MTTFEIRSLYTDFRSWDRAESLVTTSTIRTGWPWNGGSIPCRGRKFVYSPQCPDQLWNPPSQLFSGYQRPFPTG